MFRLGWIRQTLLLLKKSSGQLVEGKQVLQFGESSVLIIRRSTSSRLLEICLPSIDQMGKMIIMNGGWGIETDGNELVIRKDGEENKALLQRPN